MQKDVRLLLKSIEEASKHAHDAPDPGADLHLRRLCELQRGGRSAKFVSLLVHAPVLIVAGALLWPLVEYLRGVRAGRPY